MKKITFNKLKNIVTNKHFFAFLCVLLFLTSYPLIRKEIFVKGTTNKSLPVVVWIDNEKKIIESSSTDSSQVLKDGGIAIYPEDIITTDLIIDPVIDGGAGQKITIKRSPVFHLLVDEKDIEVRSWDNKVASLIAKTGIVLAPKDQIAPSPENLIPPGESIIITRISEADVDIFDEIPYETIQKADSSVPFGAKKVTQVGANGKIKKTYRIRYKNGAEVGRTLISKETVNGVVNKIVSSGSITGQSNYGDIYLGMTTSFYKRGYDGKYLLVTNNSNGKSVRVKIVDFGPINGPILDLGIEAFRAIGGSTFHGHIDSVTVQLVD